MPYDPKLPADDSLVSEAPSEIRENFRGIQDGDGFVHKAVLLGDAGGNVLRLHTAKKADNSTDLIISTEDGSYPHTVLNFKNSGGTIGNDKTDGVFKNGNFSSISVNGIPIQGGSGVFTAYASFNGTTTTVSSGLKIGVLSPGVYVVEPVDWFADIVKEKKKRFCLLTSSISANLTHDVEYPDDFGGEQRFKVTIYNKSGSVVTGAFTAAAHV